MAQEVFLLFLYDTATRCQASKGAINRQRAARLAGTERQRPGGYGSIADVFWVGQVIVVSRGFRPLRMESGIKPNKYLHVCTRKVVPLRLPSRGAKSVLLARLPRRHPDVPPHSSLAADHLTAP